MASTPALNRWYDELRRCCGTHLRKVILFGSRARGDATEISDYDCLAIFDDVTPTLEATLDQLAGRYLLEEGIVISCVPLREADLPRLQFEPFLINAQKEGQVL